MFDTLEVIHNIDSVIMESSSNVCDAIISIIDKNELITEYSDDQDVSDIFMESMMVFMEYVSKDKDEITKWMDKEGYFYHGDNPKKKKECMRIYHFLKQHKFDPKTSTYESDIDDGKGGKKRIKIVFEADKVYYPDDRRLRPNHIKSPDQIAWEREIRGGKNASYDPKKDTITLPIKKIKGPQAKSQTTLKHEEGHAASFHKHGKKGFYTDEERPDLRKKIDEYKATGKAVNNHDDDVEEMAADEYGIKNAKFRTKKPGKERSTKASDIDKKFSEPINYISDSSKRQIRLYKSKIKQLEKLKALDDITDVKQLRSILIMFKIDDIGVGDGSDIYKITHDFLPDILNGEDIVKIATESIENNKGWISKYKRWLNETISKYTATLNDRINNELDEYDSKFLKRDTIREMKKHKEEIKKLEKKIRSWEQDIEDFKKAVNDPENKRRLSLVEHIYMKKDMSEDDKNTVNKLWKEIKATGYIDRWIKSMKEGIAHEQETVELAKGLRSNYNKSSSTQMRIKLAKEIVKEYFDTLYDDWFLFG